MNPKNLYNKTTAVFIDVDNTLILWRGNGGKPPAATPTPKVKFSFSPNKKLIADISRRLEGEEDVEFVLWSARGRQYAEEIAKNCGVTDLFAAIVSKPNVMVDDEFEWWKRIKIIKVKKKR